jgi:uncharacterized alkaline shock family protein YloU
MEEVGRSFKVLNVALKEIVSKSTLEVPGVSSLIGGFYQKMLRQSEIPGIEVTTDENENAAFVDVTVTVEPGHAVPTVAENLQRAVKESLENMTGLDVRAVNVTVDKISEKPVGPKPKAQAVEQSGNEGQKEE